MGICAIVPSESADGHVSAGVRHQGVGARPSALCVAVRRVAHTRCDKVSVMPTPENTSGTGPTSSSRNRYVTKRTLTVAAVIVVFLLCDTFIPW